MIPIRITFFHFLAICFQRIYIEHFFGVRRQKRISQHLFAPSFFQTMTIQVKSFNIRFSFLVIPFYFAIQLIKKCKAQSACKGL